MTWNVVMTALAGRAGAAVPPALPIAPGVAVA